MLTGSNSKSVLGTRGQTSDENHATLAWADSCRNRTDSVGADMIKLGHASGLTDNGGIDIYLHLLFISPAQGHAERYERLIQGNACSLLCLRKDIGWIGAVG